MTASRDAVLRRGMRLAALTVGWNVLEGVIAIAAGALSSSVALVGFGVDSFIETASGFVVGYRLREELRHRSDSHAEALESLESLERKTARIAGALLLFLAVYVAIDATRRLLGFGGEARESIAGIVLTAVSLTVMPILGRAKLRTAEALRSRALRADAYETIACAWLSLTTLLGLAANAAFSWWWADPAAALVLVPFIAKEGFEGWKGEDEEE